MTVTIVDVARPVLGGVDAHLEVNVAPGRVTGGVDTHLDLNVAAALDGIGGPAQPPSTYSLPTRRGFWSCRRGRWLSADWPVLGDGLAVAG